MAPASIGRGGTWWLGWRSGSEAWVSRGAGTNADGQGRKKDSRDSHALSQASGEFQLARSWSTNVVP